MATVITKPNSVEVINNNLMFGILTNGKRRDIFEYEKYSDAKERIKKLKRILKFSSHEIIVLE